MQVIYKPFLYRKNNFLYIEKFVFDLHDLQFTSFLRFGRCCSCSEGNCAFIHYVRVLMYFTYNLILYSLIYLI